MSDDQNVAEWSRKQLLEVAQELGIDPDNWVRNSATGKEYQIKDPKFESALRRIVKSLISNSTQSPKVVEQFWRGKEIVVGCENLEDLLNRLKNAANLIQRCIDAGVKADFSEADDDYIAFEFTEEQYQAVKGEAANQ